MTAALDWLARSPTEAWLIALCALALATLALKISERRRLARAIAELPQRLAKIGAGELPIESLSASPAPVRALSAVLQGFLRDYRRQRAEIAQLNDELRQRVAQRTDALERVIGTLRHQATRDVLTGLFNRRFFEQYLPQAYQRSVDAGANLALLMIDIDHFKHLNDTLGHAAGDELLRSIGQIMRSSIRGEDAAFRPGGDEFVIVMPGSGHAEATALAGRLKSLVQALSRPLHLSPAPALSIGIVTRFSAKEPTSAGLLREADAALYAQKRNRPSPANPAVAEPAVQSAGEARPAVSARGT